MLVILNTPDTDDLTWRSVITLDTRTVLLISKPNKNGVSGKVHWGRRRGPDKALGKVAAVCSTAIGIGYYPYTGKATEITCSKCADDWWHHERVLGAGGADFIQRYG